MIHHRIENGRAFARAFPVTEKKILFLTGNIHKVEEVRRLLLPLGFTVQRIDSKKIEIQSDDLREIIFYSLKSLGVKACHPVMVEDSGLFIHSLKGFPGPYSSYVYKTIGLGGILKLLGDSRDRRACFLSVVGIKMPTGRIGVFTGKVDGTIARSIRGSHGFGFDPIFVPKGYKKTFGEMSMEEKNKISHRARAVKKAAGWLVERSTANGQ